MMNGTICQLCEQGVPVTMVYATSGDAGLDVSGNKRSGDVLAAEREKEVSKAIQILGVKNPPVFLHLKDGHLPASRNLLVQKISEALAKIQPDVVITFGPEGATGHPDHIAVFDATGVAFDEQKSCKALLHLAVSDKRKTALEKCSNVSYVEHFFSEDDSNDSVNIVVDSSKFRQKRIDSFFCYDTQFNQNYRSAWVKFTEAYPYEEFIIARLKGKLSNVASINDLFANKL